MRQDEPDLHRGNALDIQLFEDHFSTVTHMVCYMLGTLTEDSTATMLQQKALHLFLGIFSQLSGKTNATLQDASHKDLVLFIDLSNIKQAFFPRHSEQI